MDNQQGSFYKTIDEFPTYEINSIGEVRNKKTHKLKYIHVHSSGYVLIQFKKNGKAYTRKIHRLVAEYFVEKPSCSDTENIVVKHKDNNKQNNVYTNLEWDSQFNNMQDAFSDNLIPPRKGELNGRSILTESLVHEICKDYELGMLPQEAMEKYKISRAQATKIRVGFAWKHVWEQYKINVNRRKTFNDQSVGT